MIPWVDEECRAWGAHKRWLVYGTHDGYPSLSMLGKLIKEGPGACSGSFATRVPIKDDPLAYTLVSVALARMAETHEMEEPYAVVWAHYFFAGKAKAKAPDMGIALRSYWQHLHAAHAFIAACEVGDVSREIKSCARNLACA